MIAKVKPGAIVVPWNFSENSRVALDKAIELAKDGAPIRVVHVATPLAGPDEGVLPEWSEKQKCWRLEKRFRQQLPESERYRNLRFYVRYGWAGREIARFARQYQARLIVIAPRERQGLAKLLFGGLAAQVMRLAGCPVLVLQGAKKKRHPAGGLWSAWISRRGNSLPLTARLKTVGVFEMKK